METQSPVYSQDEAAVEQETLGPEKEAKKGRQGSETISLSIRQKLILLVRGHVFLGYERRPGWKGSLPLYAFRCPLHGIQTDYTHGFHKRLDCPLCSYSIGECPQEVNI